MRRNLYFRLTLLLVAILLVGCSGGSGSSPATTEINSVLNQYQSGMKKMNAESIANLFVYPLELDGEVLETKEQAIFMYSFLFGMIHIHEYEIRERVIIIDSTGTNATVEGIIFAKITSFWGTETNSQPFVMKFRKVGGKWKISG